MVILVAIVGLPGCGEIGKLKSDLLAKDGKFVDAPVQGLTYISGGQSGTTGPSGEFKYEYGQPVTFSIGKVVIGKAMGADVITPIELVLDASPNTSVTPSTPAVVRIAQFLLTASTPTSTGMKIDQTVIDACATQQAITLSSTPEADFNTMISTVAATAGVRPVTTATDAESHFRASMNSLASNPNAVVLPPASITGGGSASPINPSSVVGTYEGTAVVTVGGSVEIAKLSYTVHADGTLDGTVIDVTDNNRTYVFSGSVNQALGTMSISFTLAGGSLVTITGKPTSGTWIRNPNGTNSDPPANGTYTATKTK